jgi:hypothetical protein
MAKIIHTEVFTYAELKEQGDKAAIDKAAEWLRECAVNYDWWDSVYEIWQGALEQIGFREPKINFSGFWSQGDGASFTARIDVEKLAKFLAAPPAMSKAIAEQPVAFRPWIVFRCNGVATYPQYRKLVTLANYIWAEVRRTSHRYSHKRTCNTYVDLSGSASKPRVEKLLLAFREDVESLRLMLCDAIYSDLEEEYNCLISEESISDLAEVNEYTFTAQGKRFG